MKEHYDYVIVGSGLFGLVWNYQAQKDGKSCLIIEKRNQIGGNIRTRNFCGIPVHMFGPHIFQTNNKKVWDFLTENCDITRYINQPLAIGPNNKLFNMPFNMNTFYEIWKTRDPKKVKDIIQKEIDEANIKEPKNLEEKAISLVGKTVYEYLIKEYSEKQWGRDCKEIPASVINRLPMRFTFDNNYFNSIYQCMPNYNQLIDNLAKGADIVYHVDYNVNREKWNALGDKVIYTGPIDEFFDYQFGKLDWRTVRWEDEIKETDNYQGAAVINYTTKKYPYTRSIEHRHFYTDQSKFGNKTLISYEYSDEYTDGKEKFYPINDEKNNELYNKYKALIDKKKFIFGGRLAEYRYYDMGNVIEKCLEVYSTQ